MILIFLYQSNKDSFDRNVSRRLSARYGGLDILCVTRSMHSSPLIVPWMNQESYSLYNTVAHIDRTPLKTPILVIVVMAIISTFHHA